MFIDYLNKSYDLTFLDLVIIGILGGLFVNLFTFVFRKIFIGIKYIYIHKIKQPIKKKIEEIRYKSRVKNNKITNKDMITIMKKKRQGIATEEEIHAYKEKQRKHWESLPEEKKKEIEENKEKLKQVFRNMGL
jgi:hypothetical protein